VGVGIRRTSGRVALAFWWLEPSTVLALSLALIAAVYIGFAVADGRLRVIAVDWLVAGILVIEIAAGVHFH
jgi:hypothetical protein